MVKNWSLVRPGVAFDGGEFGHTPPPGGDPRGRGGYPRDGAGSQDGGTKGGYQIDSHSLLTPVGSADNTATDCGTSVTLGDHGHN